ncbi:19635_t:CDS:1, partial [Gigaspora rosea]
TTKQQPKAPPNNNQRHDQRHHCPTKNQITKRNLQENHIA